MNPLIPIVLIALLVSCGGGDPAEARDKTDRVATPQITPAP